MKKFPIILLALALTSFTSSAQSRWGVGVEGGVANVLNVLEIRDRLITQNCLFNGGVYATCSTSPADSSLWAYGFNYPTLTLGLAVSPYGSLSAYAPNKGLGSMYSFYAGSDFYVLRAGCFATGPYLRAGLAYARDIYDPVTNPGNQYIGTPVEGYFALGWNLSFLAAKHYELILSAGFNHHSCGKMFLPNWGVTDAAVNLGFRYHPAEPFRGRKRDVSRPEAEYKKGMNWNVYTAYGLHSCETIWEAEGQKERTNPCFRAMLGADGAYRYSPFLSTGIGLEGGWTSGVERLRSAEKKLHPEGNASVSPFWMGAGLIQSVHYGNFSAHVRIGWYLYHQVGTCEEQYTGPCYQKVGFRYKLENCPIFFGFDMKTHHFDSSDCLELSVGAAF